MNQNDEILIQQYLEGTLSPEAKAAFDGKMAGDPHFSEQVTQALGKRLGGPSEAFVQSVGGGLDAKIGKVWKKHNPAGAGNLMVQAAAMGLALLVVLALGLAALVKPAKEEVEVVTAAPPSRTSAPSGGNRPSRVKSSTPKDSSWVEKPGAPSLAGKLSNADREKLGMDSTKNSNFARAQDGSFRRKEGTAARIQGLPADPSVKIKVLGSKGTLVRRLYQGAWKHGQILDWNGKDDSGSLVRPGTYKVVVETSKSTLVSKVNIQ